MAKTIVIAGYGAGISDAVARKFGAEGFQVALVARNEARVQAGAERLSASGITARGFACDLGDTVAVERLLAQVRASLGPITVLHWNAYAGLAGDLTTSSVDELRTVLDVGVHGLLAALQAALPDLRAQADPALLVTGGGLAFYGPQIDAMAVKWGVMGLAVAKAAQHKLVGLLHHKLAPEGIYVGEVVVRGTVKGTAFDSGGQGTLDPSAIADRFWQIYQGRRETTVDFTG